MSSQTLAIMNGDWKFEPSHFDVKNWHDDVCVGSDGAYKLMNIIDFLMLKSTIIERNNKFIEQQSPFEEDLDLDFWAFYKYFRLIVFMFK